MAKFTTMMMLCAVLTLSAPALCLPDGAAEEVNIEKVDDVWHPIESLAAPDETGSKPLKDDNEKTDSHRDGDDRIQGRSVSGDTSEDGRKYGEKDEGGISEGTPLSTGDEYYDYEYPLEEDYEAKNGTEPEGKEEPQDSTTERVKRHSLQLVSEESMPGHLLQKRSAHHLEGLNHHDERWRQSIAKAQYERERREQVAIRQLEQQRRPVHSAHVVQVVEQPARIILRQKLQPGPASASDSSQLGYRLQALLSGRAQAASSVYSPSQQGSKQVSATFNPVYAKTNLGYPRDSSRSDAAKVLYTLGFLSKLQGQQGGSGAHALFGKGFTSGSSTSLYRPYSEHQAHAAGGGFTQLSEIQTQPADASVSQFAIVRLLQPLIRFVAVQRDTSPNQWESFVEKLSSQESSAGYKALVQQIQTENLKQHRFRQRLSFWRRLAQRLQRSQQELPCVSK